MILQASGITSVFPGAFLQSGNKVIDCLNSEYYDG